MGVGGGGSRVVEEILPENKKSVLKDCEVRFSPVEALFCFAFLVYNPTDKRVI